MNTLALILAIGPLLTLQLGDTWPYCRYCPGQVPAGCSAVAMASAMTVASYPPTPVGRATYITSDGTHTVQLSDSAAYNWSAISAGDRNEAARLIAHCAMAAGSEFGRWTTSGCQPERVVSALRSNFGYEQARLVARDTCQIRWHNIIAAEIEAGRPVIYVAADEATGYEHTFVVDGFDADAGLWHIDWGMRGVDNGWQTLEGLHMQSMDLRLLRHHRIVTGLVASEHVTIDLAAATSLAYDRANAMLRVTTLAGAQWNAMRDDLLLATGVSTDRGIIEISRSRLGPGRCLLTIDHRDAESRLIIEIVL